MEPINGTPVEPPLPEISGAFSEFGPKRVKTKELDIEQWDPEKLERINRRKTTPHPTFCNSLFCIAKPKDC